jgi:sugar phosphate isomerase/epimerase
MRIGLSALSFSYRCGLVGRGTDRLVTQPLTIEGLLTLASRAGLHGVEFPFIMLTSLEPEYLNHLRARLTTHGLTPVLDSNVIDVPTLEQQIPAAAILGARVVRVLLSDILEGGRTGIPGGWATHLDEMIARLRHLRPLAEHHGVCIAVENHQDATAEDLIQICTSVGGEYIGVSLDPINALTVAEEPLQAIQMVAPYIRNLHLADFLVYPSEEGYRLVRCALGEGCFNFRALFALLEDASAAMFCQIELVSHSHRHVRLLTDDWWEGYGPRDIRTVLPVLRLMAQNIQPTDEDWRTPWERGANEATVALYEDQQFAASVAYLRSIGILERL